MAGGSLAVCLAALLALGPFGETFFTRYNFQTSVPNFGRAGHGVRIRQGMTFCIEPMIAMGHWQVHQLADGWTIVTNDHSPAAHYEHTLAITPKGLPEILTLPGFVWKD